MAHGFKDHAFYRFSVEFVLILSIFFSKHCRGGCNKYPQSMFKIRKIGIPMYTPVLLYKIVV